MYTWEVIWAALSISVHDQEESRVDLFVLYCSHTYHMTVYQLEQELELNLADLQHRYTYTIYMNYYNVCIRIVTLYMILTAM